MVSSATDERNSAALTHVAPRAPGRIVGIDIARALAILGMFAAHVGPAPAVGGVVGAAMYVSHGRASILFATLAGLSLALITGGPGTAGQKVSRISARRIAVRAGIVFAIGTGLTMWGTPVEVILAYYGILFLIALPFLRFRPATNFVIAGLLAVLVPIAALMLQASAAVGSAIETIERYDPLRWAGGEGITELLLTGNYPVLTWTPFVIAGIALGRLELHRAMVSIVLAAGGATAAVLAYGTAWVLGRTVDGAALGFYAESGSDTGSYWSHVPLVALLNAEEHTGTPFEIIGSLGVATVVVAGCVWFGRHFGRAVAPLVAMGSMSLTVYVGHVIAINAFGMSAGEGYSDSLTPDESVLTLSIFALAAAAGAWIWMHFCRRGPLEEGIHRVTALVK